MKNKLPDLQNHLFEMIEALNDCDLEGEKLDAAIKRSMALNELARTAVANGALMAKCADLLYGIPVSDEVPLIPKAEGETFIVDKERKALLSVPRDGGNGGFKRHRENPS
ncbi:MAG: hypothetical protein LBU19_03925, partial [Treponema sp.]|jgi:hypothetical protein|nr:hypothetical protein [Treponema sp.]